MNRNKMILGGAAVLVTIGSSLAFKAASFRNHKAAGLTVNHKVVCRLCVTVWTHVGAGIHSKFCKSLLGGDTLIQPGAQFTWATNINTCSPIVTRVTHTA
jgi:hypothetical protein